MQDDRFVICLLFPIHVYVLVSQLLDSEGMQLQGQSIIAFISWQLWHLLLHRFRVPVITYIYIAKRFMECTVGDIEKFPFRVCCTTYCTVTCVLYNVLCHAMLWATQYCCLHTLKMAGDLWLFRKNRKILGLVYMFHTICGFVHSIECAVQSRDP